jgi:hypothetical protein
MAGQAIAKRVYAPMRNGAGTVRSKKFAAADPPCREAMGRWRREALTEGLWHDRRRPSTIPAFAGMVPFPSLRDREDYFLIVIPDLIRDDDSLETTSCGHTPKTGYWSAQP